MKNIIKSIALSSFLLFPAHAFAYGGDAPHEDIYFSEQHRRIDFRIYYFTQSDLEAVNKLSGKAKAEKIAEIISVMLKNMFTDFGLNGDLDEKVEKELINHWCGACEGMKTKLNFFNQPAINKNDIYINMITKGQKLSIERQKDYDAFKAWRENLKPSLTPKPLSLPADEP